MRRFDERFVVGRNTASGGRSSAARSARLWAGFTLASSGDGMLTGAVPLLAVVVNPHPLAVSSVVAADRLPWLLLALPAGAFADKFSRGPAHGHHQRPARRRHRDRRAS